MVTASATPPSLVSGFDCLGVNVTGPGIPDTSLNPEPNQAILFDRLLRRESYCSYRGMLAGPLVAGAAQPQEISLTLPPGPTRLIQVVGIQEIGGSNSCAAEFNQAIPRTLNPSGRPLEGEVYELGRAVVDLFSDRAVTLSTEWNDLTAAQRVERHVSCSTPTPSSTPTAAVLQMPTALTGASAVLSVAMSNHTCIVSSGGSTFCKGNNSFGQLGNGTTASSPTFVPTTGATGASEVTVGAWFSCVRIGGTVKCWGENVSGQLGDATNNDSSVPVSVAGLSGAVQITAGGSHACALIGNPGTVKCWGLNAQGQLGDGTTTSSNIPVAVTGITTAISIDAGEAHTCAILSDGTARCWGGNGNGQLGNGTNTSSSVPVTVSGFSGGNQIAAGSTHTCAKYTAGPTKVACWGNNTQGQLGIGTTTSSNTPVVVTPVTPVMGVRAGYFHTCALVSATLVNCWGGNSSGQLGNASLTDSLVPVAPVSPGTGLTYVVANAMSYGSCAYSSSAVNCWGANYNNQITPP
jgi:alpha-tubulin suppressor-like RCC1 family protein